MLEFKDLVIEFISGQESFRAVDGVSFGIGPGETVCLVGESGCGKSVTALSVARLLPSPPARYRGEIWFEGREVFSLSKTELRRLRGGAVTYIFQDPANSLNPVFRIGRQIKEMLRLHRPEAATEEEVVRLLQNVGIPAPAERAANYPHELSGGMQQRVMIAMALAAKPKLLIADEPTTALDVTIQAGIIELLARLKRELGMAILLITHNLGIVGDIADRVAVMYAGQIVELGPARDVLARPLHPYTRALIAAVPRLNAQSDRLATIPGTVASGAAIPSGCRFHPRCLVRQDNCAEIRPALEELSPGHWVRCPYTDGLARG